MKYTLHDFNDIVFSGYDYKLPEVVINTINKLLIETGISTSTKTTTEIRSSEITETKYKKGGYFNNAKKTKTFTKRENIDDVWEATKVFKPTKINKKEGIDKLINDIRICLNKISNKNYETQRDVIFEYIDKIISHDDSTDEDENEINKNQDVNNIANAIFEIASGNKFYSEVYATLYKELSNKYLLFQNNIHSIIDQYKESISAIKFVDPNSDYDKFCDNNKINDNRKALTTFIVNLMKQNVLEKNDVIHVIMYLFDKVNNDVDIEDKTYEVEEITENIFILITLSVHDLKTHEQWDVILLNIKSLSQFKAKEHLSISSRSIFKYMDIMDKIKKEA
jgi:hypothetical protein